MIILYKGSRGKGKTLTLVKDAYIFYKLGYRVISNFYVKFAENIDNEEILKLNRESKIRDCVLAIDEAQLFFDSRNFSRKENKDFSNFVQQIRKRNIIILFTTQYVNTVDLRLRQHIDVVAYPKYDEEKKLCVVKYYDITKLEDEENENMIPTSVVFKPERIFNMYNTYEMLK